MTGASSSLPESVNPAWRIGIVASQFHESEVSALVESALEALTEAGVPPENILKHTVAGSFEIPLIGAALARTKQVDALIGLGIIVRGETQHAEHLAREVARGIMEVQLKHGIPFAYEVLHVDNIAQARDRAEKGREAAHAALHSLAQLARLQS